MEKISELLDKVGWSIRGSREQDTNEFAWMREATNRILELERRVEQLEVLDETNEILASHLANAAKKIGELEAR